ncbi:MAG TPA: GAF domain-containing protein [Pseudolysinimonas sp.]
MSHYGDEVEQIVRQLDLSGSDAPREEPFIITDALTDPELRETPLVKPPIGIRFYAGVPLKGADGRTLGTLSIADFHPKTVSDIQLENLLDLGALVVAQLELRQEHLRTLEPQTGTDAGAAREGLTIRQ